MRNLTPILITRREARPLPALAAAAAAAAVALGAFAPNASATYSAANTVDLLSPTISGAAGSGVGQAGAPGQQIGYSWGTPTSNTYHATIWTGTAASGVDINPAALLGSGSNSITYGAGATQQVGYGYGANTAGYSHAIVWSGSAASAVDLNPASILGTGGVSYATGAGAGQQVGYGYGANTSSNYHALLWTGTAASAVDLNPTFLGTSANSLAYATNGTMQVGGGFGSTTSNLYHALLWFGTAASAVDVNPTALLGAGSSSEIYGMGGNQQVGYGYGTNIGSVSHALLWTGTAASAVDLHPAFLGAGSNSEAFASNGAQQVGYGWGPATSSQGHALLWSGSAASAIDLHTLLPSNFTFSTAKGIDVYGNVTGYGINTTGNYHPIAWLAGDTYVLSGTGAWNTAANWTAGVPAAGNDVLVIQPDAASRTVTYSSTASAGPLGDLTLDATGAGSLTLSQTGGTLAVSDETVGLIGTANLAISGGTHLVSNTLALAARAGSAANLTLSGTGVLNAHYLVLNPGSTFSQTGGTLVTDYITQSGGTVGAGTLTSQGTFLYTGGTFTGRLANAGTAYLDAPFTAGNGIENTGTLEVSAANPITVNGAGLDNLGTFTLDGGLLSGAGPVVNDVGGVMSARGTVAPGFTNYGDLSTTGLLALSSASTNYGTIRMNAGQGIRVNAPFSNSGPINLAGGSLSGSASLSNFAGGSIVGPGGVSAPLANAGGSVQTGNAASLVINILTTNSPGSSLVVGTGSQLSVLSAFSSAGTIQLTSPTSVLSGGTITNTGTVKGLGQITNNLTNNGTIRAEGGELDLTGTLTNSSSGQLQSGAGTTLYLPQGLATNAGTISLTGGAFDAGNQPMTNNGTINGNGTIRAGAITNSATGSIFLASADSSVFAPVTNNAGGTIKLVSNTTTFFRPVTNNGAITLTSAVATFAGGLAGNAPAAPSSISVDAPSALTASYLRQDTVSSAGDITLRPASQGGDTSAVNTLSLTAGSLDLADNKLILSTASTPLSTLRGYLLTHRLFSSIADADPQHRLALGYVDNSLLNATTWGNLPVDATDTVLKTTYLGDANLDGVINADDYALLDKGYRTSASTWALGDFNYDGAVTSADYLLIDRNFTLQSGTLSPDLLAERESQFGPDYVQALIASVPEPALALSSILYPLSSLLLRRRR